MQEVLYRLGNESDNYYMYNKRGGIMFKITVKKKTNNKTLTHIYLVKSTNNTSPILL
jgi:hypothetical protein